MKLHFKINKFRGIDDQGPVLESRIKLIQA